MNYKKIFFCSLLLGSYLMTVSQKTTLFDESVNDTATVNRLIQQSKTHFTDSPALAIDLAIRAKLMAEKLNYAKGAAYALKNIGITYYYQAKFVEALDHYLQSLEIFKKTGDNVGIANMYSNIGVIYYDRGDDAKALENYLQSLKFAELSGDKLRMLTALNNIGGVYNMKEVTHEKALEYYLKALPLCEELGKQEELGAIAVNTGSIYFEKNDDTKAMFYFNKALKAYGNNEGSLNAYNAIGKLYTREQKFDLSLKNHNRALQLAKKMNVPISIVQSLMGLGEAYAKKGENENAVINFKEAEAKALEITANHEIVDIYQGMAKAYAKSNNYDSAFKYQSLFSDINDTLYNIETGKKLGVLQFDFDLQKKQTEINLLTKDKALTDLQLKRQRLVKNASLIGLVLLFLIALLIFRNYRIKVKTNHKLDQQKAEIEQLVLNILPSEIANELKLNGQATPRNYESVSVMFTDFKDFTVHADKLAPQELVKELNTCFMAFDDIIEKYKLEKIKTIGDSYMCAGGIPTPDEKHAENIVNASLEVQQFIVQNNKRRTAQGLEPWDLRIGIHTGPVLAGVVGKKKYAYDIWGSTVNIASRMESNGVPGQVNISASVYEIIKDNFICSYRGKIYAKNVGEIDMYFVEKENGVVVNIKEKKLSVSN